MIVSTFAGGADGWAHAARSLGMDPIGIELDASACALRAAVGLLTIRADVSTYPLDHLLEVTGLIASPPCPDFSAAGKRAGLKGKSGPLVYEPLRWAKALRPEWIACEQVKEVLPIWRQTADELRTMGYSTWCGILDAASYGTPQHRRRAILMASRVREVQPPPPTHAKGGSVDLWGYGVKPLTSMATALGWTARVDTQHGNAPTFDPSAGPARTVVRASKDWCWERPATTVQGTPRIAPPGHHERQFRDSIPVEMCELGVLQDFPFDHPWDAAGTREAQARCVGNAIPVRLAKAILSALTGQAREAVA